MKTTEQSNEALDAAKRGASLKTLNLEVAITEPDLHQAVRQAFDLAKGGGRELNLDFNFQSGS